MKARSLYAPLSIPASSVDDPGPDPAAKLVHIPQPKPGFHIKRNEVFSDPLGVRLVTDNQEVRNLSATAGVGSLPLTIPSKTSGVEYGVLDIFKINIGISLLPIMADRITIRWS